MTFFVPPAHSIFRSEKMFFVGQEHTLFMVLNYGSAP
ncbi:MAG: hypothetical protein RIR92_1646 [Pseudomonadota bacterium]|jgi:hypothetical protein